MNANLKTMRITVEGKTYEVTVELLGEPEHNHNHAAAPAHLVRRSTPTPVPLSAPASASSAVAAAAKPAGAVGCPLSGTIVGVHVTEGQAVKAGDLLVTLEAMKMNTPVRAPSAGTVRQLAAIQGAVFEEGAALLVLE